MRRYVKMWQIFGTLTPLTHFHIMKALMASWLHDYMAAFHAKYIPEVSQSKRGNKWMPSSHEKELKIGPGRAGQLEGAWRRPYP